MHTNGTYLSCGHRELLPFKALAGRGALERAQGGAIVKAGPIRRRVRLRTNVMASHGSGHLFCMVRKRTLPYAVESTILNLAELRCLA
ncbi:MAG: hypothetical protein A3G24_13530 [Betaproteobacteria bacterium RIFCSPLOWO2_12_FULL_62_13]|nr:MAG: hypothetical protein A3G24_13530 [Betaproteobacteria bacterium RIFCSPLOWO2_12_FULL_62_13]